MHWTPPASSLLALLLPAALAGCNDTPSKGTIEQLIKARIDAGMANLTLNGCVPAQGEPGTVCEVKFDRPQYNEWMLMSLRLVKANGGWSIVENRAINSAKYWN